MERKSTMIMFRSSLIRIFKYPCGRPATSRSWCPGRDSSIADHANGLPEDESSFESLI